MYKATSMRAVIMFGLLGFGALSVYATGSSCVDCHTNEATMKRLVIPPSGGSAEGEG